MGVNYFTDEQVKYLNSNPNVYMKTIYVFISR